MLIKTEDKTTQVSMSMCVCECRRGRTKRNETKGKLNGCSTHLYAEHRIENEVNENNTTATTRLLVPVNKEHKCVVAYVLECHVSFATTATAFKSEFFLHCMKFHNSVSI